MRPDSAAMQALRAWLAEPDAEAFPYEVVVAEFNRVGKHFVPRELLLTLDAARVTLPAPAARNARSPLARFLDCALDKFDGRYDNPSYLGVDLLPLPGAGGDEDADAASRRRDRLFAMLVADLLRFELEAADGLTTLLPELRPDARLTAKRCRLAVRALRPALARLGLRCDVLESDGLAGAREVFRTVFSDLTPAERRTLRLTAMPVYVAHDEYMFIRVLQAYETTFAVIQVHLRAAMAALADGRGPAAARALLAAERAMREAKPLFSLVATMLPEAFLTFREFTDGASAIQSRSYKAVESLCRRPEQQRVDSPAYRSVPEVRERVLAGQPTVEEALHAARESGRLTAQERSEVRAAMQRFEAAILAWRQTHYRLAVRMLGERRGTGYTEGVPYLSQARSVRLFTASQAPAILREAA
jgi:tryptophan 2,3-dioxygenase